MTTCLKPSAQHPTHHPYLRYPATQSVATEAVASKLSAATQGDGLCADRLRIPLSA